MEMNLKMKMSKLMDMLIGMNLEKRFDYNEWLKWWIKLTTSEQTLKNNWIQNDFYNEKTSLILYE